MQKPSFQRNTEGMARTSWGRGMYKKQVHTFYRYFSNSCYCVVFLEIIAPEKFFSGILKKREGELGGEFNKNFIKSYIRSL